MTNKDLFDKVEDPINRDDYIEKIIDIYSKRNIYEPKAYAIYLNIPEERNHHDKESLSKIEIPNSERLYVNLFNKWKNNVIHMSNENYHFGRNHGLYDEDFLTIHNTLLYMPDVKDFSTIQNLRNDSLYPAYNKYFFRELLNSPGWCFIKSAIMNGLFENPIHTEHRFYLNLDESDIVKFSEEYIKKCEERNLKYSFKFSNFSKRDDVFIIYSDSDNLINNYNIINEIKEENPDIVSRTKNPPFLTGVIDGWIGYGSEPLYTDYNEKSSYSFKRCEVIDEAIENVTKRYLKNLNKKYKYKNGEHPAIAIFNDLVATDIVNKDNSYDYTDTYIKVADYIKKDIDGFFEQNIKEVNINNHGIYVEDEYIKMTKILLDIDPNFKNDIKNEYYNVCDKHNISKRNTCFGNSNIRLLQDADYRRDEAERKKSKINEMFNEDNNNSEQIKKK